MLNRRQFLAAASAIPAICTAQQEFATPSEFWSLPRELWLKRAATGEVVRATYWYDGKLNVQGYDRICWALRDVRANQAVQMSVALLDVLRGLQGWLSSHQADRPLITHSGYRSPSTNAATEGAAHNSLHTQARAWDGHIEGVSVDRVARFGAYLAGGGVGFYASKSFVHLDDGRRRYWSG